MDIEKWLLLVLFSYFNILQKREVSKFIISFKCHIFRVFTISIKLLTLSKVYYCVFKLDYNTEVFMFFSCVWSLFWRYKATLIKLTTFNYVTFLFLWHHDMLSYTSVIFVVATFIIKLLLYIGDIVCKCLSWLFYVWIQNVPN